MNDLFGKFNASYVWLLALGAVLLGIGGAYATAGLGSKVSSGVYFGVFLAAGFAASAFTKAKVPVSLGAMIVASLGSAATYYFIVASAVSEAAGADEAGGVFGAALGIFVAVITLVVSAAGGIGGVLAGVRARKLLASEG